MKIQKTISTRSRGSVMLFVVVLLVLLAMIGTAYLQQARYDQVAATISVKNNIDTVANATLAYIGEVLKTDLLSADGTTMFDATENIDEPYDYPWTNTAADPDGDSIPGFKITDQNGNVFANPNQASGGALDDTWLASAEPDFSGTDPVWPHITNLNGYFLRLPKVNSGYIGPVERVVDYSDTTFPTWHLDFDVPMIGASNQTYLDNDNSGNYDKLGADADGDGIYDSKWTWAPIRQISGVSYVMAVRIIDNSSMINANSSLSQVSALNTFDSTTEAPSWYNTSELDFGNFYYSFLSGNAELLNHLNYLINAATLTQSLVPFTTRSDFWQYGPYLYGNYNSGYTSSFQKYSINEEVYLRYRNGLNNIKTTSKIGTLMPSFLRSGFVETTYTDTGATTVSSYFTNDPRHLMTVKSGNAIYAAELPGLTGYKLKKDINKLITSGTAALAQSILDVYSVNTPTLPTGLATAIEFSKQAAVNIIDYADVNNQLTPYDSNNLANTRFGMEALPAITEVYVQRPYLISSTTNLTSTTWQAVTDANTTTKKIGYAIEIRNPFRKPVKLTDVYLYVNGIQFINGNINGTVKDDLAALTGLTQLPADGTIILYHKSIGGNATNDNIINQINTSETPSPILKSITDSWPWASGTGQQTIYVELRATVADDLVLVDSNTDPDVLTWGYQKVPSVTWPAAEASQTWINVHNPTDPDNMYIYRQYSTMGSGDGLNSILVGVSAIQWKSYTAQNPASSHTVLYHLDNNMIIPRLGLKNKTINQTWNTNFSFSGGPNSVVNTANQQILISDTGTIDQIGELMQITMVGMNTPAKKTFAQNWNAQSNADNFRLSLSTSTSVDLTKANLTIPHAYYLMDQYVTQSPYEDGLDNDGDNVNDNATELFISGTININTAPRQLLNFILPIPNTTIRNNLVNEILAYRDMTLSGSYSNSATRAGRVNKGIAFIGELLGMTASANGGTRQYAIDGSDTYRSGPNNTLVDFISNPALGITDGIKDDREERILLANQLMGVVSTRSDIFTAYIIIRGYPSGDFTKGVIESKQLLAVFDRSNIIDNQSTPKLLAIYEYN